MTKVLAAAQTSRRRTSSACAQNTLVALRWRSRTRAASAAGALSGGVRRSPLRSDPSGTADSVAALTARTSRLSPALLHGRQRHRRHRRRLDRAQAEVLAEPLTAGCRVGEAPDPLPPVADLERRGSSDRFPSSQTHLYMGQPGMRRLDPDYFRSMSATTSSAAAGWCPS
jgi:zinc protease